MGLISRVSSRTYRCYKKELKCPSTKMNRKYKNMPKKLGLNKTHNKKSFKKSLLTDGLDDLFNWADDFENSSFGQNLISKNSKVKRKKSSKTVDDLLIGDDDHDQVAAKKHKKETKIETTAEKTSEQN